MKISQNVTFDDFQQLEIRVGRVVDAAPFPEGKHSSHILQVDFGSELGRRKSLARLSPNYDDNELVGRHVLCLFNIPARQIGKHLSEVLILGVPDEHGNVVLIRPDADVPLGGKLH